jgi:uncharacterized protein
LIKEHEIRQKAILTGDKLHKIRFTFAAVFVIGIILAAFSPVYSQQPAPVYTRADEMIPMRDGVRLYTQINTPNITGEKLPILFLRTPYGIGNLTSEQLSAALPELSKEGYIIVQQDIRGRFKSEGEFVMLRQPRDPKDKNAIDESTDTYDTIEWLLKNTPNNNGKVGMAGTSYGGWLTVMGMLDPHPALKAVAPHASPADMWIGDDFHHNGAFRLSYGFEYTYMMESSKEITDPGKIIDRYDAYEWYLKLGALSNVDANYLHKKYPTWNDLERFCKSSRLRRILEKTGVRSVANPGHRADLKCGGLVGSGRFLWSDKNI